MVKFIANNKEWYIDGYLASNLDKAKKFIKKDWDMFFIVDGSERSGKSNMVQTAAAYCDPTLCLDRIVFTPTQFEEAVLNAEPFTAIIWDEAVTAAESGDTSTKIWKTLKKMMVQMGQKNLFIFVVIHSFFDLTKYLSVWRSRALIHIYHDDFERGYFQFYNEERKKYLYIKGKKYYEYKEGKPNFIGRFTKGYYVDEQAYRDKKKQSLLELETEEKENDRYKNHLLGCIQLLKDRGVGTIELHNDLKKIVPNCVDIRTIQRYYKELSDGDKKENTLLLIEKVITDEQQ